MRADKLSAELQRLHFLPAQPPAAGHPALGLAFARSDDWPAVAALCQAIQDELDLPAPAISIDGQGYRLWFALAEAADAGQATGFLDGLRRRYLADLPVSHLGFGLPAEPPPCQLSGEERWTAFIDPGMGGMFVAEPWLDMPANRDQQADLLAGFRPIGRGDFVRALATLQPPASPTVEPGAEEASGTLSVRGEFTDPQKFLLAVMNDPLAGARDRIEAAKALLPYFAKAL